MRLPFITCLVAALLLQSSHAYRQFQGRIPNGDRVPSPCPEGGIWSGVGHQGAMGGNAQNPFGVDFKAAGLQWTRELCRKDSDGDGQSNGEELGDPECAWRAGGPPPARAIGITHPGLCPLNSKTCTNPWTVCPKAFNCPAMKDAAVYMKNITFNSTRVPPKVTTYKCQAFELNNTADAVHMIGSRPIIVNQNVMHHMLLYACKTKPQQALFESPWDCFMGMSNCQEIINLWGFGSEGECFNSNTGVRIGGGGYRFAVLQLHWNNPSKLDSYMDASGFSLYYTTSMRRYDQGVMMYGEANLVLPPRQPQINFNHTCPSVCTRRYHAETRYITGATIHMHGNGVKGRISLSRNGSLIKDLVPLQVYDYNSPEMVLFDPPVEYLPGDEITSECYFSNLRNNYTIFQGEGTNDEMCFSFMTYYPNNISLTIEQKLDQCIAVAGINQCWLKTGITPHVEQNCSINPGLLSGSIPAAVSTEMLLARCFQRTGCDPACKEYLTKNLWPSQPCYDPKRARKMAEVIVVMSPLFSRLPIAGINQTIATIANTLAGQRYCEDEINMLAEMDRQAVAMTPVAMTTPSMPEPGPQHQLRLTSEHLLIIIIVCSCLGFIIIMAVLAVIASKMSSSGKASGEREQGNDYKVYDNPVEIDKTRL